MTNEQPSVVRSLDGFYPREMFVGRFPGESIEYSQEDDFDPDSLVEESVRYVRCDQAEQRGAEAERRKAADVLAENARLRDALERSRKQFQFYADQHWAKNTEVGRAKAHTNHWFAVMCDAALAAAPAQEGAA